MLPLQHFDSVVNRFFVEEGGLRPGIDAVVGYIVHSALTISPASYPATLTLGLKYSVLARSPCVGKSAYLRPMRSKAASRVRLPAFDLGIGPFAPVPEA